MLSRFSILTFIYIAALCNSLGVGAIQPIVPIFAQTFGANFTDLGLIGMVSGIPTIIIPFVVGYAADRFNRAYLLSLALAINAATTVPLFLANSVHEVILIRALAGIGNALFWPSVEILIPTVADAHERIKAIGRYSLILATGFTTGPYLGGLLAEIVGLRSVFLISSTIIGLGFILSFIGITPLYKLRHRKDSRMIMKLDSSVLKYALPMAIIMTIPNIAFNTIVSVLPGYLHYLGFTPFLIGINFVLFSLGRTVSYGSVERLTRFGEFRSLVLATVVLAVSLIALGINTSELGFMLLVIPVGIALGSYFPITLNVVSRNAPRERLGTSVGIYEAIQGFGWAFGPILTGGLSELYGPATPYALLGFISLIELAVLACYSSVFGQTSRRAVVQEPANEKVG